MTRDEKQMSLNGLASAAGFTRRGEAESKAANPRQSALSKQEKPTCFALHCQHNQLRVCIARHFRRVGTAHHFSGTAYMFLWWRMSNLPGTRFNPP
jgi:hypothetical protein